MTFAHRRWIGDGRGILRILVTLVTLGAVLLGAACANGRPEGETDSESITDAPDDPSATTATEPDSALRRLASELLPSAEERSGLEARGPIALARSPREKLEAFLISELDEELPPEKAAAITSVYVRLGLLPADLDLRELLRSLYLEQVVGYYDPSADTLFVREGVAPEQLEPVLLHEIVHALQDQHMNLDSLMRARSEENDAAMAARAAVEGHATFAMLEWQLGQAAGSPTDLTTLPDLGGMLSGTDLAAAAGMPVLSEAPRLIRESLLFPYIGGLTFVQRYWTSVEGRPVPLNDDVPTSTEQILHPDRYADPDRDAPSRVRFLDDPPGDWVEVYSDGIGELETRILLSTFLDDTTRAAAAAGGWDGDRYRLLRRGGASRGDVATPDDGEAVENDELLVWASVWDSEDDAADFARRVEEALQERYRDTRSDGERRVRVLRPSTDRPSVLVIDTPVDVTRELDETAFGFSVTGGR